MKKQKSHNNLQNVLMHEGKAIKDYQNIANGFNDYFIDIGTLTAWQSKLPSMLIKV